MGTMQDYLDRLPHGLESYPDCRSKSSFLREKMANLPPGFDLDTLPLPVREFVTNPAPASLFLPSVPSFALNHAILDSFGNTRAFLDYSLEQNRKSLSSPLYRMLFAVASPKKVLERSTATWKRIHHGIELTTTVNDDKTFTGHVTFPPHLVFPEMLAGWAETFAYIIGLAGGRDVEVNITEQTSASTRYAGHWR